MLFLNSALMRPLEKVTANSIDFNTRSVAPEPERPVNGCGAVIADRHGAQIAVTGAGNFISAIHAMVGRVREKRVLRYSSQINEIDRSLRPGCPPARAPFIGRRNIQRRQAPAAT